MADEIQTKNITTVDTITSIDNTDKVFVNDNGSFKQISVSNLMKQAPSGVTEETDPTVSEWAKQPTKPSYTADEVGALPVGTKIPAKTSDLTNDSGYLTQIPEEYVTETELGQKGYITEDDIPDKLPSPGTLTFTGAVNDTYDGSTDKTINIPTGGGEGGTSDYNALANKPKLNGVEIVGNKTSADYKIVSSEQGVENNGKYLGVGADGNVTPVDKPTYTANEVGARPNTWMPSAEDVGALPNDTEIPSKTSDLTNDSGFITNEDIPEKLPNPQKIIFTGAVSAEYDGSSQQTINIPESTGGDSYALPIMSDTQLGGGKAISKTDEDVPVAVDPETGQLFVPTYPVQGGITEEQKQQLEQNTQDITDLKSAINEKWTDISPGEIFEISTNGNDNVYKLEGLAAYFDFTKYPDGYSGDVEDLSGNNTEIMFSGLDLYESGRNGFVNGKLMINNGPLSNAGGSKVTIKSEAIHTYPFSIEIYAHLRRDYNPYAGNNVLTYENTGALQNHQCTLFSTQYNSSDGIGITNNGVKVMINKENVAIQGSANVPNVSKNVPGLEIDGIQNENIGDRYDHIVVCFDSNKQKFYLNNELIIDNDEKSVSLTISSVLRILPDQLKGDIKLIRIYEGMLSDEDVEMNYLNAVGGTEDEI